MEEQILQTDTLRSVMAGFDDVWTRVTGREAPPAHRPPERCADILGGFAQEEQLAAAYDRELSGCFRGDGRTMLLTQANRAGQRATRLRAEVFLQTGQCSPAAASCPRQCKPLDSLRDAMLRDRAAAESYDAAAGRMEPGELSELLCGYARERRESAQAKRELILRCFR